MISQKARNNVKAGALLLAEMSSSAGAGYYTSLSVGGSHSVRVLAGVMVTGVAMVGENFAASRIRSHRALKDVHRA